ncbi:MAG: GIY-YIG nuclease family protein [Prevotella sp.]|nr:GIY-YIG nuclease family protein [Prevotella sp.]
MNKDKELDDILNDPLFDLNETEQKLFELSEPIKKGRSKKRNVDEVAQKKRCENFADYAHLFAQVHQDLRDGKRSLVRYKEDNIQEKSFFIADGLMGFIDELDVAKRQIKDRVRKDGRSRVIYEDGTESNILFRTIGKNITKNGYVVTEVNDGHELDRLSGKDITDDDLLQGWIYILRSKSEDERIASVKDLYKIGFTTNAVKERIKNARNEATYLMADVEIVSTYRVYNVDVHKLEGLIHDFFHTARFYVCIDGVNPEEWFVVPLPIIREAIVKFMDGSIIDYTYNREQQALERSVYDSVDRTRTEKFDTTGLDVLSLCIKQKYFDEIMKGEKDIEYRELKPTTMGKLTRIDKETGKRYIRRPDILRLYTSYTKDHDVLLVRVTDVMYEDQMIEYHLGKIVEYDIKKN